MTDIGDLRYRIALRDKNKSLIANVWAAMKNEEITIPYSHDYMRTRRIDLGSRIFTVRAIVDLNKNPKHLTFAVTKLNDE